MSEDQGQSGSRNASKSKGQGAAAGRVKKRPIALSRRFLPSTDEETTELDFWTEVFGDARSLTWDDVLGRRRVVVLAEAGSGKSTELEERSRLVRIDRRFSFFATVQNVGEVGLDTALHADHDELQAWRASSEPAWFFLDSIDEAKDRHVPLKEALVRVAQGIAGCESRAHIVLSGRHTDWEFRRDLQSLSDVLPVPPEDQPLPPLAPDDAVVRLMRQEEEKEPPPAEAPLVVFMAPLNRHQVETFARAKGVANADTFIQALDKSDLWRFARRPIDLGWLVDYWREQKRFGTYAQMLEKSLRHRLLEHDPQRARHDDLDRDAAMHALERIGAALVFQKLDYVLVPDTELTFSDSRTGLDLREVLQDWSAAHITRLINRPVFDAVVAGLARLHHDNQGAVRSFLAARWLKRLLDENCPKTTVLDLLFATTYGVRLIIPSIRETAAWLAIWDTNIAQEVIVRDPVLLMGGGDPASLPLSVREEVLRAVIQRITDDENFDNPGHDNLQRFSRPDLVPAIRGAWKVHKDSPAVRELLLLMIWLGELTECADLAVDAAFSEYTDRYTMVFAGRALMSVGSPSEKRRYVEHLKQNAEALPVPLISNAVDTLFPTLISVDDLLHFLTVVTHSDRARRFDYVVSKLPERLESVEQIERLIDGLIATIDQDEDADKDAAVETISTIAAASLRVLELLPPEKVSDIAIDGVLLATKHNRHRRKKPELTTAIYASPQRRRRLLYRAATSFTDAPGMKGEVIMAVWQFQVVTLPIRLEPEDMTWLIKDVRDLPDPNQRKLAADAWMLLANEQKLSDAALDPIRAVAQIHAEVADVVKDWTRTRSPSSSERESARELQRLEKRNAIKQAADEKSWKEFADRIRRDPDQLRAIPPPQNNSMDRRLHNLWRLLNSAGQNRSRYSIDSLHALAPIFDDAVQAAIRDAFIAFWRHWRPTLKSQREPSKRNSIHTFDCVGMVGLGLEAATDFEWAKRLTPEEAKLATGYATLELNGFPRWLRDVAVVQPDVVRDVLWQEVAPELTDAQPKNRAEVLEDIARAPKEVGSVVVERLFTHLTAREDIPPRILEPALRTLSSCMAKKQTLIDHLLQRIELSTERAELAIIFEHLFLLDPAAANEALERKMSKFDDGAQTLLVQAILPRLIDDGMRDVGGALDSIPLATLQRLVPLAYRTIRIEDDRDHSDGKSYSPNERDDAESARSALFGKLVNIPGRATFAAIHTLMKARDFPIPKKRLLLLAEKRAATDSEHSAWTSQDVRDFEDDHTAVPRSPADLQRLVFRRLTDLQHDLLNADFSQGSTLSGLDSEEAVQKWLADRMEMTQGRSYSIERESRVTEEKEPDVRFRARAANASVPMEIKVAESWTLPDLQVALVDQLVGQYLRDRVNRYGILLLVHQTPRPKGWWNGKERYLTIHGVVRELQRQADTIASSDSLSPQAVVALLDVSTAYARKRRFQRKPSKKGTGGAKKLAKKTPKTMAAKASAKNGRKAVAKSRNATNKTKANAAALRRSAPRSTRLNPKRKSTGRGRTTVSTKRRGR